MSMLVGLFAALLAASSLALAVGRRERGVPAQQLVAQIVLAVGALPVAGIWAGSLFPILVVPATFFTTAVPLAIHDLRTGRMPNWLVAVCGVSTSGAVLVDAIWRQQWESALTSLLGAAGFLVFYFLLYIAAPGQLGGGDVKLALVAGAVLGWSGWPSPLYGLFLICLISLGVHFVGLICRKTRERSGDHPHGPAIAIATFLVSVIPLGFG
ncbi:A24 family peptidase [Saccharopolyspora sp. ID03-671]|uniref:prepilin peptidase n=1 Tax=Saccharopolyspora sp. ID03-671 TaxID=3073066 RepID=UPI00324C9683